MTFIDNGVYRIRGIVSLSTSREDRNLCDTNEYVIFTDVAKYLPWIENVVPGLESGNSNYQDSNIKRFRTTLLTTKIYILVQHFEKECKIVPGTTILKGWSCKTEEGRINFQDDGNLVIFDENDKAIWMSNTWTHPKFKPFQWGDRLEFQMDGNLVIYNTNNQSSWASNTKNASVLVFQEDRNFVIYSGSGAIWASHTYGTAK